MKKRILAALAVLFLAWNQIKHMYTSWTVNSCISSLQIIGYGDDSRSGSI